MDPHLFKFIAYSEGRWGEVWFCDKFQNVYDYICKPIVIACRVVSAHRGVRLLWVINAVKVAFESLFYVILGLANILAFARFASYAINEVIAVAGNVVLGRIFLPRSCAGYVTGSV